MTSSKLVGYSMSVRGGLSRAVGIVLIAVAGLLAGAARGYCALPSCTSTIAACGCVIRAAGTYDVTADLSGSDTCIKVVFPGAKLNLNNHNMTGSGSGSGVLLNAAAVGAVVNGGADFASGSFATINGFATGIENFAPGALLADFSVEGNGVGVENSGAGATLALFDASGNSGAGVDVMFASPSSVRVLAFSALFNGGDGIDLSGVSGGSVTSFDIGNNAGQGLDLRNSTGTTVQSGSIDSNGAAGVVARNISKTAFIGFLADSNTQGGLIIKHATASAVQSVDASSEGFGLQLDNSSGMIVNSVTANNNTGFGIKVSGGGSNFLSIINSNSNGTYGVWLNGSSGNSLRSFTVDGSGLAGVYIGCSTTGPNGTTCASVSSLPSNHNTVVAGLLQPDASKVPNGWGVAIDTGNKFNKVKFTIAAGSAHFDADDENSACGTDVWAFNSFGSTNPAGCIH